MLTVVFNWFGLFCLPFRSSRNWVWSFLLTHRPPSGNWIWSFYLRFPTVSKKDEPRAKRPQLQVKKTHPFHNGIRMTLPKLVIHFPGWLPGKTAGRVNWVMILVAMMLLRKVSVS